MVCQDCEKKLTKVIVPDKWKDGANNISENGGRATTYRNSLLQVRGANQRYTAGVNSCRICKSKVAQQAHYCQQCAHHNGICAMCGKRVEDLRFDNRGKIENLRMKRTGTALDDEPEGFGTEGGYGTEGKAKKKATKVLEEEAEAEAEAPAAAAFHETVLEQVSQRIAQNSGGWLVHQELHVEAAARDLDPPRNPYAGWASAFDAGSNRAYYFNAATRRTSWVWPPVDDASSNDGFISSATFTGAKPGFVFAHRAAGLGYHRDVPFYKTASCDHQNEEASSHDSGGGGSFAPSAVFLGARPDFVFTTRNGTTGYYKDAAS